MFAFARRIWSAMAEAFRPKEPWEQYLAEATDLHDLERRLLNLCR